MGEDISSAEIESLCRRPAAFDRFVTQLLDTRAEVQQVESVELRRWGRASLARRSGTLWWLWPGAPEDDPVGRWRLPAFERPLAWLRSRERVARPELQVVVARAPEDPSGWAERLAAALRERTGRRELSVRVHGPRELQRWARGVEDSLTDDHFRLGRVLAARSYDYSACERALIQALDRGEDPREHWLVVADELQRRGDPTGESLALALAVEPHRPSLQRTLSREYREHESKRMVRAPRHTQMFAFVDHRGPSFDVAEFLPGEQDRPPIPEGHPVRIWAERIGPFFVRLLTVGLDPEWRGLGLPDAAFAAPELRYLSATRISSIHPDCADVSGRDLSGFELGSLIDLGRPVFAYAASLRGCDLRRADLSGWQLDGADLRDAVADLDTGFGRACFDEARVSPGLRGLIDSWNAGRQARHRGRARGVASVRGLIVDDGG